jgi:hypothetical protein
MNLEIVQTALVAAIVISYGIERILKPAVAVLEALGKALIEKDGEALGKALLAMYHLWPFYVSLAVGSWLAWYTGLNFVPVFAVAPVVGRVFSCLLMGMGPGALYDLVKLVVEWVSRLATKEPT